MAVVAHAPETSEAVLEGESLTQYRQRMRASAPSLDSQIALIPHDEGRRAVGRFLDEQRILPDRIVNWVRRIEGWTNGLGASGGRPVTWEAVVQGIDEMLDTNPPGQSISPAQLLTFVERAERTRKAPEVQYGTRAGVAPKANTASSAEIEQHALVAFARDGDSEAIAECERRGIDYVRAIA
ncbi:hypothetical protein [Gemmatimonas sp.]|jgi:hypothetical protein|uniref:hypothetical protein n=1 Tax=Gemmatimonas sp. TaxID=1962908 RepID=UPI0037BFDCED